MLAPPFDTGAVQLTTEEASLPDVADTPVGASGTVTGGGALGVAGSEGSEAAPSPALFVAVTVNV